MLKKPGHVRLQSVIWYCSCNHTGWHETACAFDTYYAIVLRDEELDIWFLFRSRVLTILYNLSMVGLCVFREIWKNAISTLLCRQPAAGRKTGSTFDFITSKIGHCAIPKPPILMCLCLNFCSFAVVVRIAPENERNWICRELAKNLLPNKKEKLILPLFNVLP